jgi:hypothetical protein
MYGTSSNPMAPESRDYSPSAPTGHSAPAKYQTELCSPLGEELKLPSSEMALPESCPSSPGRATAYLSCWRTADPAAFDLGSSLRFRAKLLETHADSSITQDPAAAVGTALDLMFGEGLSAPHADLAMSALLLHTLQGDLTAPLVLAQALRRLARTTSEDRTSGDLATRWAKWNPAEAPLGPYQPSRP